MTTSNECFKVGGLFKDECKQLYMFHNITWKSYDIMLTAGYIYHWNVNEIHISK